MMKCETCQHWARWKNENLNYRDVLPNLGSCRKVIKYWEALDWYDDDHNEELNEERRKDSKFFVQDGEDYSAHLFTRNDFGCVEHQEKTNEQ